MVARPDLPEEILIHIFSRLPAKSVGKLRSLSKTWRNLLSTPHFIKSHLALQNTRNKSLILIPPSSVIRCVETIRGVYNNTVSRELNLPGLCCEFLGSCDGLVLLKNRDDDVFLVNPITMEQSKIPDPPVPVLRNEALYGFGYDSVGDDYKVVAVFYPMSDSKTASVYIGRLVYVYYVKRGVWKKIESSPRHYGLPARFSGVFLNGAIHWLVPRSEDCAVIAALDLDSEVFFEIPAPSVADMNDFFFGSLSVLGGCLCVVADTLSNSEGTDVWVMKDYGAAKSWRKFTVSGYDVGDLFFKPLCFVGDGEEEVVLLVEGPRLVVYNVNDGTVRDMVVDRVEGRFLDGGTFVESLVSPA